VEPEFSDTEVVLATSTTEDVEGSMLIKVLWYVIEDLDEGSAAQDVLDRSRAVEVCPTSLAASWPAVRWW
jgi:hypothetical protein